METTFSPSELPVDDLALVHEANARIPKKSKVIQETRSDEEPDDEDIEEPEGETRLVPFRASSPGASPSSLLSSGSM